MDPMGNMAGIDMVTASLSLDNFLLAKSGKVFLLAQLGKLSLLPVVLFSLEALLLFLTLDR